MLKVTECSYCETTIRLIQARKVIVVLYNDNKKEEREVFVCRKCYELLRTRGIPIDKG